MRSSKRKNKEENIPSGNLSSGFRSGMNSASFLVVARSYAQNQAIAHARTWAQEYPELLYIEDLKFITWRYARPPEIQQQPCTHPDHLTSKEYMGDHDRKRFTCGRLPDRRLWDGVLQLSDSFEPGLRFHGSYKEQTVAAVIYSIGTAATSGGYYDTSRALRALIQLLHISSSKHLLFRIITVFVSKKTGSSPGARAYLPTALLQIFTALHGLQRSDTHTVRDRISRERRS